MGKAMLNNNYIKYKNLYESNKHDELSDFIDTLSHEDRIKLRMHLTKHNLPALRNLYFDYITQEWIKGSDFPTR